MRSSYKIFLTIKLEKRHRENEAYKIRFTVPSPITIQTETNISTFPVVQQNLI